MIRKFVWTLPLLFVVLLPTLLYAQTPTAHPGDSIGWAQTGPDLATVQAYIYHMYENGPAVVPSLQAVSCAATAVVTSFNCQAVLPSLLSIGSHSVNLTASNAGGESPLSAPFPFLFQPILPATPAGIKIIPKP